MATIQIPVRKKERFKTADYSDAFPFVHCFLELKEDVSFDIYSPLLSFISANVQITFFHTITNADLMALTLT